MANSSKRKSAGAAKVSVSLARASRAKMPPLPLSAIAKGIFRVPYSLSVALVPESRAKALNRKYRMKTYSPNVLSFALSRHEGEIVLNLAAARRQHDAGRFSGSFRSWVAYLLIHSMLHLNGMRHGRTMEQTLSRVFRSHGFSGELTGEAMDHGATHHHRH